MDIENFTKVLDHIKANPELWNQIRCHCGTTHSLEGWSQILMGNEVDAETTRRDARIFLDINHREAYYLFSNRRTIKDFETVLEQGSVFVPYIHSPVSMYNREGYDHQGYDRNGYDRNGYNNKGYDCYGLDQDGLDINNKPR